MVIRLYRLERQINTNRNNTGVSYYEKNTIFQNQLKNPYAKHLKKQVTLRLGIDVIDYFKKLAEETGVPYQKSYQPIPTRLCSFSKKAETKVGF